MARHTLLLRLVALLGLLIFGAYLAVEQGYVQLTLDNDRSYLSYVILSLYLLATLHWFYIGYRLSVTTSHLPPAGQWDGSTADLSAETAHYVDNARTVASRGGHYSKLLEVYGDRLQNRHAAGHFIADTLLRLGLLGTIIGFILMLLPVAEITNFEPSLMQQLLGRMSGGMAVALYTTLSGLVTSTLLKLQYQILDGVVADHLTRLAELSEVELADGTHAP